MPTSKDRKTTVVVDKAVSPDTCLLRRLTHPYLRDPIYGSTGNREEEPGRVRERTNRPAVLGTRTEQKYSVPIFKGRTQLGRRAGAPHASAAAKMASNHPLPTPPGQPMEQNQSYNPPPSSPPHHRQPPSSSRQQTAPASHQAPSRRSRGFSFRSEKSHKSSDSAAKVVWSETHQEKESKRLHSKADPSLAMNEAEPCRSAPRHLVTVALLTRDSCRRRDRQVLAGIAPQYAAQGFRG